MASTSDAAGNEKDNDTSGDGHKEGMDVDGGEGKIDVDQTDSAAAPASASDAAGIEKGNDTSGDGNKEGMDVEKSAAQCVEPDLLQELNVHPEN